MRAVVLSFNRLAILIVTALLAGYLLGRWGSNDGPSNSSVEATPRGSTDVEGAFVLLVNMKFESLTHRDTFLEWIEPVCRDVLANEGPSSSGARAPTTLSYRVAISDKDPLLVVVMERYSDKEHGYLEVHRSGSEFLKFREKLKGMSERGDVTIEGESYLETGLGYV